MFSFPYQLLLLKIIKKALNENVFCCDKRSGFVGCNNSNEKKMRLLKIKFEFFNDGLIWKHEIYSYLHDCAYFILSPMFFTLSCPVWAFMSSLPFFPASSPRPDCAAWLICYMRTSTNFIWGNLLSQWPRQQKAVWGAGATWRELGSETLLKLWNFFSPFLIYSRIHLLDAVDVQSVVIRGKKLDQ